LAFVAFALAFVAFAFAAFVVFGRRTEIVAHSLVCFGVACVGFAASSNRYVSVSVSVSNIQCRL
jgi:hypothetical protein